MIIEGRPGEIGLPLQVAGQVDGVGGHEVSSGRSDVDVVNNNKDDDPHKHEAGSRFYDFSVHLRQKDNGGEVVPLLRFSTQSHAKKMQWIDLTSQACVYCDSDKYSRQPPTAWQQLPTAATANGSGGGGAAAAGEETRAGHPPRARV